MDYYNSLFNYKQIKIQTAAAFVFACPFVFLPAACASIHVCHVCPDRVVVDWCAVSVRRR